MDADVATDSKAEHDLAVRTSVAVLAGAAGLLGPDAGAAATALTPALEALFSRAVGSMSKWRLWHAAQTLEDAAAASGEPVGRVTEKAVASERSLELLARTLTIAQDTALRDKRRALGRALAAGIAGDNAKIDDELLFVRAVADIDTPHIRLLALMASEHIIPPDMQSENVGGWSLETIATRDPGLGGVIPPLLATLESHGLVRAEDRMTTWGGVDSKPTYNVTAAGRMLLERLTADGSDDNAETRTR